MVSSYWEERRKKEEKEKENEKAFKDEDERRFEKWKKLKSQ